MYLIFSLLILYPLTFFGFLFLNSGQLVIAGIFFLAVIVLTNEFKNSIKSVSYTKSMFFIIIPTALFFYFKLNGNVLITSITLSIAVFNTYAFLIYKLFIDDSEKLEKNMNASNYETTSASPFQEGMINEQNSQAQQNKNYSNFSYITYPILGLIFGSIVGIIFFSIINNNFEGYSYRIDELHQTFHSSVILCFFYFLFLVFNQEGIYGENKITFLELIQTLSMAVGFGALIPMISYVALNMFIGEKTLAKYIEIVGGYFIASSMASGFVLGLLTAWGVNSLAKKRN